MNKNKSFPNTGKSSNTSSRYRPPDEVINRCVLSILTINEPGALARIVGLFSARGYNIESLCVAETDSENKKSKVTIVTSGTPTTLKQIKCQLARIVPVEEIEDLTSIGDFVECEVALFKVVCEGQQRVEVMRLSSIFRAKITDATLQSFVVQVAGRPSKINALFELLHPLGLVSMSRTGVAAMLRS